MLGHLESIAAEVFEEFQSVITEIVDRQNGIYALYDNDRLYYVGLARNLKARLKAHLRDRHKGLWNRFSVYLTNGDGHMKELESLMLRVIKPEGNKVKGKLKGSADKRGELDRRIKEVQDAKRFGLLGRSARKVKPEPKTEQGSDKRTAHPSNGATFLKAHYKGKEYRATLRNDGSVRLGNDRYTSLSAAGRAVTKRSTNGRHFWKVRNANKEWVRLSFLEV